MTHSGKAHIKHIALLAGLLVLVLFLGATARAQEPGSRACPVWMEYYSRETKKVEKHCFQNLKEAMAAKRKAEGDGPDRRDPVYLRSRLPKTWHSDYESWRSHTSKGDHT